VRVNGPAAGKEGGATGVTSPPPPGHILRLSETAPRFYPTEAPGCV